jgi:hypothetical protein
MDTRHLSAPDTSVVVAAATLNDSPPGPEGTPRLLAGPGHHRLAYAEAHPVGFGTGIELPHSAKGAGMFGEPGVAAPHAWDFISS